MRNRTRVHSARLRLISAAVAAALLFVAAPAAAKECPGGRSSVAAMWLSILHAGTGEYYLNGWGNISKNAPQHKFWFGFIPFYGTPGYLQVKSAIDASNCRTDDI